MFKPVFSIRLDSKSTISELADAVSNALSVKLRFERLGPGGIEIYSTDISGFWLDLSVWPPWDTNGIFTFQFQGRPDTNHYTFNNNEIYDISTYMISILKHKNLDGWYIPSNEQIRRELDLGEQVDSDA